MSNVKTRYPGAAGFLAGVVFAVGLLSGSPALAVCVPNNFPNNWLMIQENAGGITIANHVGVDDLQLVALYNQPGIPGVSTYITIESANLIIQAALLITQNQYNQWSQNANVGDVYMLDTILGQGIFSSNSKPAGFWNVKRVLTVVTIMQKLNGDNCLLLESYPVL